MVGTRVGVRTQSNRFLGRGTYVKSGLILLDTGSKIAEHRCGFVVIEPCPIPGFGLISSRRTPLYILTQHMLDPHELLLQKDQTIYIQELSVGLIGMQEHLVGAFLGPYRKTYWVKIDDLDLPEEKPSALRKVK
jgi:hypothetical protein